jgi:hypothetical protein
MARKSMTELLADLGTMFPDNTTGLITPQILRDYFTNYINAIRPAYALLERQLGVTQALTVAPAPVVFTSSDVTSALGEYTATANIGRITHLIPGTVRFTFTADLLPPANQTRTITFTLYKNGVATPWRQSISTSASGVIESVGFTAILYDGGSNVNYDLYVQIDVATTFTLSNMVVVAETVPVNAY